MIRMSVLFAAAVGLSAAAAGEEPATKGEAWVGVRTEQGSWVIRVAGGPAKQVADPRAGQDDRFKAWKDIPGGEFPFDRRGPYSPDGKTALYFEEDPATAGAGTKLIDRRHRVMLVGADGKDPKQLLTGLMWWPGFYLCPDGKSVVCGAEEKGKWYPFRVGFDGTVTKLSETAGVSAPAVVPLPEGRILYCAQTGQGTVRNGPFSTVVTRGPAILIEGKKETVLIKETDRSPSLSADAAKMAVAAADDKGEPVVRVTDRTTGKAEDFPVKGFRKDWACGVRELEFSPDGKALAVTFHLGGVVLRQKGPLPGDEAEEHFGVIWLDGRKDRTALFRVEQPPRKGGYFARIEDLRWSAGPPAKK
jgi:hypothetical protein